MSYDAQYARYRDATEAALAGRMKALAAPEPLLGAMRYSLLAGGKRLRPVLLLASCEMAGGTVEEAMPYAVSLEMIHAYSLIHDDLPAMDNDDFRRGRPTNHKVYGEGMALLAGDGLLSLAFETMLEAAETPAQIEAMRCIARAAGTVGMVAGQCADLACEAKGTGDSETLRYIHRHKTADLFIGAVTAGLSLAGAKEEHVRSGQEYACALGLAFQIEDDLLDIEGDAALLGKATGMDVARGKLTWPAFYGVEASRAAVREMTETAYAALAPFGEQGAFLRGLAGRLLSRDR